MGTSDPVRVPFTLPPGTQNEGQFAFHVNSIAMPQRLKGILTFIVKVCHLKKNCASGVAVT
jgi:hypothetical protein